MDGKHVSRYFIGLFIDVVWEWDGDGRWAMDGEERSRLVHDSKYLINTLLYIIQTYIQKKRGNLTRLVHVSYELSSLENLVSRLSLSKIWSTPHERDNCHYLT